MSSRHMPHGHSPLKPEYVTLVFSVLLVTSEGTVVGTWTG